MKVTNRTAYATIGCDVQLSENDRIALGIELNKVMDWLETAIGDKAVTEDPYKAIDNLATFISKFAVCPSQSNVFTDSPEDFKKADETTTAVEPASTEDNVITVDITSNKKINLVDLTKLIYHATDANRSNISDLLNSAAELRIPNISFKCTRDSKRDVIYRLEHLGYTIVQNTAESLQLENYMVSHK